MATSTPLIGNLVEAQRTLLQDGTFSDITVICRGRTWKCHRSILCPRCPFFQAALGGNFKESETSTITLDDDDPEGVQLLLEYLYTLDLTCSYAKHGEIAYFLGDKYGLLPLRTAGKDFLIRWFGNGARVLDSFTDKNKAKYLSDLGRLWSWEVKDVTEIKDAVLAGLCTSVRSGPLLQHQGFQKFLGQNKDLSLELMMALAQSQHSLLPKSSLAQYNAARSPAPTRVSLYSASWLTLDPKSIYITKMAKRKSNSANDDFVVSDDTSRNGSTAPPSKRPKKSAGETTSSHFSTPSATTPAKRDAEDNLYWEISKARRVVLNDFKGKKMISIREYYEKDGNWLPGKKGISMTLEQYGALMGVLPAVDRELRRGGVEDLPRPDYSTSEDGGAVKDEPEDETEASEEEEAAGGGRPNHEATSDEEE